MKNRKGSKELRFNGKIETVTIDDTPPPYSDIPRSDYRGSSYSQWGDGNVEPIHISHGDWERDQRILAELSSQKGVKKANAGRTQKADNYWLPWQKMFKELLADDTGHNATSAREEIRARIEKSETWYGRGDSPTERTLIKRLTLTR